MQPAAAIVADTRNDAVRRGASANQINRALAARRIEGDAHIGQGQHGIDTATGQSAFNRDKLLGLSVPVDKTPHVEKTTGVIYRTRVLRGLKGAPHYRRRYCHNVRQVTRTTQTTATR